MFERPRSGERAILVHLDLDQTQADTVDLTEEFAELARSAGAVPLAFIGGSRRTPDPRTFVGSGKLEEIREAVLAHAGEVVLFDHALSPSQERNLEKALGCRVLDRTGLILDIFAQRARSFEGKLQVELAQLQHLSTRLVRGWTHLERQKGGIGLRGPGETQLETDRRLIGGRIRQLTRRLEKVRRQREQGRRTRLKHSVPTVSLVGYTNAGKSTLFNRLTESDAYSADQLFATLDPTLRRLELPGAGHAVLADTVGFIRQLPHDLVDAFHSTLQETEQARLLLHVIDAGDPERAAHIETVNDVLHQIGAEEVPQIQVFNKIDRSGHPPAVERDEEGRVTRVWVSAKTGAGIELLVDAIREQVAAERVHGWLTLSTDQGRVRALLFGMGAVCREDITDSGAWRMEVELPVREYNRLCQREGLDASLLEN